MFCTSCGKEIPNEAKVCGYCGKEISFVPETKRESGMYAGGQPEVVFGSEEDLKATCRFNLVAFCFVLPWLIIKGMWDAVLINVIIIFVCIIPFLGWVIAILWSIFWGRNGNYYYYLKRERGISFLKAFSNTNLRKI